ncbi:hypothetical protein BDV96DRAFT_653231 [Lophiotrema nucula]|uniref:Uncharacterized protein n=1 Tax=Lophiotrema nucula TaxID=690887 RepID=A0A6A5YMW2_9PLEO|nr:hypothetical protein BDV96DRAFT_653231 [Lophiotrema nucula]
MLDENEHSKRAAEQLQIMGDALARAEARVARLQSKLEQADREKAAPKHQLRARKPAAAVSTDETEGLRLKTEVANLAAHVEHLQNETTELRNAKNISELDQQRLQTDAKDLASQLEKALEQRDKFKTDCKRRDEVNRTLIDQTRRATEKMKEALQEKRETEYAIKDLRGRLLGLEQRLEREKQMNTDLQLLNKIHGPERQDEDYRSQGKETTVVSVVVESSKTKTALARKTTALQTTLGSIQSNMISHQNSRFPPYCRNEGCNVQFNSEEHFRAHKAGCNKNVAVHCWFCGQLWDTEDQKKHKRSMRMFEKHRASCAKHHRNVPDRIYKSQDRLREWLAKNPTPIPETLKPIIVDVSSKRAPTASSGVNPNPTTKELDRTSPLCPPGQGTGFHHYGAFQASYLQHNPPHGARNTAQRFGPTGPGRGGSFVGQGFIPSNDFGADFPNTFAAGPNPYASGGLGSRYYPPRPQ